MAALRISNPLNALRATRTRAPQASRYRTLTTTPRIRAQGYGDGKGGPGADDPQSQPASSAATHAAEHPGPVPPDVGKGTGGGPTKAAFSQSMHKAASTDSSTPKTPGDASAASGGSRSKEATETGGSPTGGSIANTASQKGGEALKGPQGAGAPRPKIHNQSVPGVREGLSEEQKAEVERHNAEFDKRHDRASASPGDKVDKKFWKGT
ncbi:hypothetical protein F5B20DRAFT_340874 [Whalleya microplaca]|nr:hypothetical protein F5B20DRAFT_340874 [Whalleya microplaca]